MIERTGNLQLKLSSSPSNDIDFVCWGPFGSFEQACLSGLSNEYVVDCSKSIDHVEYCSIPFAVTGEYYVLMITNYSNNQTNIKLVQNAGSGTTDCSIIGPPLILVPNAFSPNGDGLNDLFIVGGSNLSAFQMIICDRWGRVVFESNNIHQGWDGRYREVAAPAGIYYYNIFYEGQNILEAVKEHKNGIVMLMR